MDAVLGIAAVALVFLGVVVGLRALVLLLLHRKLTHQIKKIAGPARSEMNVVHPRVKGW